MLLFHLSDIQIRPLSRHKEFKSLFQILYKSLIEHHANDPNNIIIITGDILQEKDKLKPESIMILRKFFKRLTIISKHVIVIPGNHDLLENNPDRLDNLTPILDDITNISYLLKTGIYNINDINFIHNSIIDKQFIHLHKKDKKQHQLYIGLYHGMLNNAILDNGLQVSSNLSVKDFDNYDLVLLGDIHKHQYLNKQKTIAYAGSLVQQNFGEPYQGHGYIIWDTDTKSSQFIQLNNKYGFFNIHNTDDIKHITTEFSYIRYHVHNIDDTKPLKQLVEQQTNVLREEIRLVFKNEPETNHIIELNKENDTDILKKHIQTNYHTLSTEDTIHLITLHNTFKQHIEQHEQESHGYWNIDYLEFQNILIYGNNHINKIHFQQQKNGVISICGDNAIGKSCILKLIIFTLFDKTISNDKNSIINKDSKSCYIKLDFSFTGNHGKKYTILRKGETRKHYKITEVKFTNTLTENGININLEHGKKTMDELRKFLGGFDDYILTNVISNSYNYNILQLTDKARLDLFIKYFNIDFYKTCFTNAKNTVKEHENRLHFLHGKLSNFKNHDDLIIRLTRLKQISQSSQLIGIEIILEPTYQQLKLQKNTPTNTNINYDEIVLLRQQLKDFQPIFIDQQQLDQLHKPEFDNLQTIYDDGHHISYTLQEIDTHIQSLNIDTTITQEDYYELKTQIIDIQDNIQPLTQHEEQLLHSLYNSSFDNLDINTVNKWITEYELLNDDYTLIHTRNQHIKHLLTLDDIPTQDIKNILNGILDSSYLKLYERIWRHGGNINGNIELWEQYIKWHSLNERFEKQQKYKDIIQHNKDIQHKLDIAKQFIQYNELLQDKQLLLQRQYNKWHTLKQQHDMNMNYHTLLDLEAKYNYIRIHDYELSHQLQDINTEIKEIELQLDYTQEIHNIQQQIQLLEIYKQIVDKNGLPKHILHEKIQHISTYINYFITGFVNYSFNIDTNDNDGYLEMWISKHNQKLGIGDLSGYETFILHLAFKYSLLKLSNINKCGMLFIDEGLDCIDSHNFDYIGDAFKRLQYAFKHIMVISHIEDIRKFEQWNIQITRDTNGYSKIKN